MPAQQGVSCVLPSALKQLRDSVNALHAYVNLPAYCTSQCESKCVVLKGEQRKNKRGETVNILLNLYA